MFSLLILINFISHESISNSFSIREINPVDESQYIGVRGDHSWTSNGPYGGVIHDITSDSNFIYAGLFSNGVYRHQLGQVGAWEPRRNDIQYFTILSLLSTAPNKVFAGLERGGLFYTPNGGINWIQNSFIPDTASVNVIFQYSNDTLFIGTERSGIYRSLNGGFGWNRIGGIFGDTANSSTFTRDSVNLYLGTNNGIFISSDLGNTWNSLFPGDYINKLGWYYGFLYAGTKTKGLFFRDTLNIWNNTALWEENIADFSIMGESL